MNFNEYLYKYHMLHHGYCQILHYMDMYRIWYMFLENLSVAPIAVYHICYSAAVERQNHSLIKKYRIFR
jgi:hypothetical protein